MKFLSMKEEGATGLVDFKDLIGLKGKLVSIQVVSAYFDLYSVKQLLNYIKNEGHVSANKELIIIVDYFSSKFQTDNELRDGLIKTNYEIRNLCLMSSQKR